MKEEIPNYTIAETTGSLLSESSVHSESPAPNKFELKETFRQSLDFNEQFQLCLKVMEHSNKNVFITGKAGTGKSTLLKYFRTHTLKNVAVLAPTGVSAVNIQGQTIHSFFYFKPDITPESVFHIKLRKRQRKLFQNLNAIVIDEISMVRADLLDCVNHFLKMYGPFPDLPFGGVQMIFFGDLYQLPPVVTQHERQIFKDVYESPYFFDSKVFRQLQEKEDHPQQFLFMELEKIYRQKDEEFVKLLNHIRDGNFSFEDLKKINTRVNSDFEPSDNDFFIYLTTTNALADKINENHLKKSYELLHKFEGDFSGDFEKKNFPTQDVLELKKGAQVMLLNNDPEGRWVNGSVGKILSFQEEREVIVVELSDGDIVDVTPFQWEMYKFSYNEETEMLESESVGSFKQYPLRLAWAVTIHKSQGKTFTKIILDTGYGAFASGQTYVALSRCVNFEGIVLKRPIRKSDIILDNDVVRFMTQFKEKRHC